jgi:hypothetical protein
MQNYTSVSDEFYSRHCAQCELVLSSCNIVLIPENVTTHVSTKIHFPKIQDEEVMVASTMKVEFSLAIMRVHLSNLFNGNQVLGKFWRSLRIIKELLYNSSRWRIRSARASLWYCVVISYVSRLYKYASARVLPTVLVYGIEGWLSSYVTEIDTRWSRYFNVLFSIFESKSRPLKPSTSRNDFSQLNEHREERDFHSSLPHHMPQFVCLH